MAQQREVSALNMSAVVSRPAANRTRPMFEFLVGEITAVHQSSVRQWDVPLTWDQRWEKLLPRRGECRVNLPRGGRPIDRHRPLMRRMLNSAISGPPVPAVVRRARQDRQPRQDRQRRSAAPAGLVPGRTEEVRGATTHGRERRGKTSLRRRSLLISHSGQTRTSRRQRPAGAEFAASPVTRPTRGAADSKTPARWVILRLSGCIHGSFHRIAQGCD